MSRIPMIAAGLFPMLLLASCAAPDTEGIDTGDTHSAESASPRIEGVPSKEDFVVATPEPAHQAHFAFALPDLMPQVPEQLMRYTVVRGQPIVSMDVLARTFGVQGDVIETADFGGLAHVRDGARHLFVYDLGGGAYHDVEHIGSEAAIEPLPEKELVADARQRLGELGLLTVGPVALGAARTGVQEANEMDADGNVVSRWITTMACDPQVNSASAAVTWTL